MPISDRARAIIESHPLRDYLYRMANKESGGKSSTVSPTGAAGLFQFTRGTGKAYGLLGRDGDKRHDDVENTKAMVKLTEDNHRTMKKMLGREPTLSELALAHQQGAETGVRMLTGVGNASPNALRVNAVNPNASPQEAASKIMNYYGFDGPQKPIIPGMSLATNPMLPQLQQAVPTAPSPFPDPKPIVAAPPVPAAPEPGIFSKMGLVSPDTEAKARTAILGADGKGGENSLIGGASTLAKGLNPKVSPQEAAQSAQITPMAPDMAQAGHAAAAQQLMAALMANRQNKYGLSLTSRAP